LDRQSEVAGADGASGGEHLTEDRLALAAGTVERRHAHRKNPVRDKPLPWWHWSAVEGCGIDRRERFDRLFVAGLTVPSLLPLALGLGLCVELGIGVIDPVTHGAAPAGGACRPRRRADGADREGLRRRPRSYTPASGCTGSRVVNSQLASLKRPIFPGCDPVTRAGAARRD
jgi:hypothetical protein